MTLAHSNSQSTHSLLGKGRSAVRPAGARCGRPAGPCSAAVETARRSLGDRVLIHPDACHGMRDLDSAPQSAAWGKAIERALTALGAYAVSAEAGFAGGFFQWCKTSGHPQSWPATPKKLAMRESETVMNSPKLYRSRILPVATEVDASGAVLMQAHLKIAEGGGDLAPRIYFTVDPRTAAVHVGFVGPHKHMRNTRS